MAALTQEQQAGIGNFTQDQIANAVQQMKISDRRKRNEMMRLGTSDPSSFALQNQQQLQQAVQPSTELRRAGDMLNDATYGMPEGYTTKDLGLGKYEMYSPDNVLAGTGYKSLADTYSDYRMNQANTQVQDLLSQYKQEDEKLASTPEWMRPDPTTMEAGFAPQRINPDEFLQNAQKSAVNDFSAGWKAQPLSQWELLGRAMTESDPSMYAGGKANWNAQLGGLSKGGLPADSVKERISGLNTLFGSTPVFKDGKLIGYKSNFMPNTDSSYVAGQGKYDATPTSAKASYDSDSRAFTNAIWRDFEEGDWSGVRKLDDTGNVFISGDKASQTPGWINNSGYNYQQKKSGSFLGSGLGSLLGTALSFVPGLQPLGMIMSMAGSLRNDNPIGALGSLFGSSGALGELGSKLGDALNISPDMANMLIKGGMSGASSLMSGKSGKDAGLSSLFSALGSLGGGQIGNMTGTPALGNASNSLISQGLTQLYNKQSPQQKDTTWRNNNNRKQ